LAKALGAKVIIGVDPSSTYNAWAIYDRVDEQWEAGQFKGIGRLFGCGLDEKIHIHGALAIVECPTWGGFGTRVVRSAAVQWETYLKSLALGIRVVRVDPRIWQAVVLGPNTGVDRKAQALARASELLKRDIDSDHIADAVCMAYYGSLIASGAEPVPAKTKKPKAKK